MSVEEARDSLRERVNEMLEPKRDGSDKDEAEITGGKRLIRVMMNIM
ncbi:hypothetical protein ACYUJ6_15320 [Clostridium sp. JNZ X4-2]